MGEFERGDDALHASLARAGRALDQSWSGAPPQLLVHKALSRWRRRQVARRALVTAMVFGMVLGGWRLSRPGPTEVDVARDGSLTISGDGHVVHTELLTESAIALRLDLGTATFDVTPQGAREVRVEAGGVSIIVLGTRFTVEHREDGALVSVHRGRVYVLAAESRTLEPGESAFFRRPVVSTVQATAPVVMPPSPAGDWRSMADEGDLGRAWSALERSPPRNEPEDLMRAADVARLTGHPEVAVSLLGRVATDYSTDPRASVAAFTRGRIELDELKAFEAAADDFARARALEPAGPLAADALAREVEAWSKSGQPALAAARAQEYARRYPRGARLETVRRWGEAD